VDADPSFESLPIPLNRDLFMRNMLREVASSLDKALGPEGASHFIGGVGERTGEHLNIYYRAALGTTRLTRAEVAQSLVDLKRRIQGDFYIVEETDQKIVLGNRACPFGSKVKGQPALCMMTSSVFGTIAAQNLGYGKVALDRTIAQGHPECRVTVYLKKTVESDAAPGREYGA
jgi:predicted ArsR family transcriptional regulator